ncbi:MAG: hypothetical protein Kow0031_22010 [Anaerolineae bacterium]
MPLLGNGKIDRAALPLPGKERPQLDTPFIAPRTELEQQLAGIWAGLLDVDEVGVQDDFFELGGDSLLAMRLVLQVEQRLGVVVPPDFFRQSTIAQLALFVTTKSLPPAIVSTSGNGQVRRPALTSRVGRQLISVGPLWRGYALPYGLGTRLQKIWLRLPVIQHRVQKAGAIFDQWLALAGLDDAGGRQKELSQRVNTWRWWRRVCLQQPETFERWVTVKGIGNLDDAVATGRPIITVGTHTALGNAVMRMAMKRQTGQQGWTLGYSPAGQIDAVAKVLTAQQMLARGETVNINGDGAQGNRGIEAPFFGRLWLFRSGGAELALDHNAIMLPVFNTMSDSGRIVVEFLPPFTTSAQTRAEQIEELTRQYAALLESRWPSLLSNMKWGKLQQIYEYGPRNDN